MKLVMSKTLWGVNFSKESEWDNTLARVKSDGYDAVEAIKLTWMANPTLFKDLLKKHSLRLIVQIHTAGGYLDASGYVYCSSCDVNKHVESFRDQLAEACGMGAVMVNCHSGHDSWTVTEAVSYFKQVLAAEDKILRSPAADPSYGDVTVVHETHRQRLMFSPYQAYEILSHPELARLKINADLSHWVCVCEHVFEKTNPRDSWWPKVLDAVCRHCWFVHARVGHPEGPQIFDPRNQSSWQVEIDSHLDWWGCIWTAQKKRGLQESYVEPEHGPEPYQAYETIRRRDLGGADHWSQKEKDCELWDINNHVRDLVVCHFAKAIQS